MSRRFSERLARLDGGTAAAGLRNVRAAWLPWKGKPHREWPEEALEAFTRSGDAGDPEAKAEIRRMSDEDLDWSIRRQLKQIGLWTQEMEGALPEMSDLPPSRTTLNAGGSTL
jgi:hypothetical protein